MKIFDDRADAEVVGHAILLSITVLGVSMILLYGIPAISSLQDLAIVKNSEQAFTVLDSRTSRAALGDAPRQITDFNLAGGYLSVIPNSSSETSYILVEFKNETTILNSTSIPMGKIVYRLGDREIAYEGGGVWSKYPAGSIMLSPPEFHYNGITLTLPVISISGNSSIGGKGVASINIEKKGDAQRIYPSVMSAPSFNYTNPLPKNVTKVNVSIISQYYDAWEDYFKSIPLTKVYPNASAKKVTIILETPPPSTNFTYGMLGSDEIWLNNKAALDSYNSSRGNYSVSKSGNGSIRANKGIKFKNNATVNGSALSGGEIRGEGCGSGGKNCKITRDAYGTPITNIKVSGTKYPAVSSVALESTTSLVAGKIAEYKALLPNVNPERCLSDTSNQTLSDGNPGFSGDTCTIYPGNYYLTKISLDSDKNLIFDTNSGPINIALDISDPDDFEISKTNITVSSGNYPVKLYLGLDTHSEVEIKNSKINRYTNPNDTSSRFLFFVSGGDEITFKGTKFCGAVFAPDADIKVDTTTEIFGALTGKKFEVEESQQIHFDEALQSINTGLGSGTTVMYLHVTRNDLGVSMS